MAEIQGYVVNRAGDPPPWGAIEDQFHDDIIDKIGPKSGAPCSHEGHTHDVISGSGNYGLHVDSEGRLVLAKQLIEGVIGFRQEGDTLWIDRYVGGVWVPKIPLQC
jgi:hypothetical protein